MKILKKIKEILVLILFIALLTVAFVGVIGGCGIILYYLWLPLVCIVIGFVALVLAFIVFLWELSITGKDRDLLIW